MSEKDEKSKKPPEFEPKFAMAFMCLMLHKLGGYQTIPLENLKDFNSVNEPKIYWDEDKQAFTIANKGVKSRSKLIKNTGLLTAN